ncbi:hypothetical protein CRYUN_Cryun07bG0159100 [Craigia yunnanensis]
MSITIGIFVANLLNYFPAKIKAGRCWRLSLGGAIVPGLIIFLDLLKKIGGVDNVDEEFNDLANASEAAKLVKSPWKDIVRRKYRPQLTFAILIPFFQQLTGMNEGGNFSLRVGVKRLFASLKN